MAERNYSKVIDPVALAAREALEKKKGIPGRVADYMDAGETLVRMAYPAVDQALAWKSSIDEYMEPRLKERWHRHPLLAVLYGLQQAGTPLEQTKKLLRYIDE